MIITILTFLFTMSVLVTVHEYGHFQVAKWCGVKVLRFSIGFGKPLWSKSFGKDKTELVIAAIPLGGYVKMLDEGDFSVESSLGSSPVVYAENDLARAFNRQTLIKRIAIVLAGPAANLLLAIAIYWILFAMGVVGMKPIIGKVLEQSPAAMASLARGELIQKVNGKDVNSWQDVSWILLNESLKNNNVEVQAITEAREIHVHQLDLSKVDQEAATKDILTAAGLTIYQPDIPAKVGEVTKDSPAYLAGLQTNDLVLSINKHKVNTWEDFVQTVRSNPEKPLEIKILRDAETLSFSMTPEAYKENGKTIGRVGIAFKMDEAEQNKLFVTTHYSTSAAFLKATEKTWDVSIFTLKMLGKMLTGQASLEGVSGPVTIASYAGQSAKLGMNVFLGFLALISISIGVLNLLPIPVLDGGHLMYYVVEIFTGKPASDFALNIGQKIGFFLLGCMMILAFYNDINRLITG
jgi:regulator of sigma E protease